jgi:hypothetical protein
MRIRNNRKKANFVNFKLDGFAKKVMIPAQKEVEIATLKSETQILNKRDFNLGFFEIVKVEKPEPKKKSNKVQDTLEKVKKQVLDYTSKSKKKKKK